MVKGVWCIFLSHLCQFGRHINLASEGDYSFVPKFIEIKVCICVWVFLSSHLLNFIICAMSAGVLFTSGHNEGTILGSSFSHISHICNQAGGQSSTEFGPISFSFVGRDWNVQGTSQGGRPGGG